MIFAAGHAVSAIKPVMPFARGYDDPPSVALSSLNWIGPDKPYATTAVTQADAAGLLPVAKPAAVLSSRQPSEEAILGTATGEAVPNDAADAPINMTPYTPKLSGRGIKI